MARIISGVAKNIPLKVPFAGTRPITDRAKSALFSILYDWIEDAEVLDLFAGSGSLGIEALSRGAKFATLIDSSLEATDCIKENLYKTNLEEYAEVINDSFENYVKSCRKKFDLIFIDPPYEDTDQEQILISQKCLKKNGLLVIKHSPKFLIDEKIGELEIVDTRKYGENSLSFFKFL